MDAKKRAKELIDQQVSLPHTDNSYDIDECIEIKPESGCYLDIKVTNENIHRTSENGWMRLPKTVT